MKNEVFLSAATTSNPTQWLSRQLKTTEDNINSLFKIGAIYIDGQRTLNCERLKSQQLIRVHLVPRRFKTDTLLQSNFLFENKNIVAIDKPRGIPSVPIASNALENCLTITEQRLQSRLYPLHRLDELTQGVLLSAKDKQTVVNYHRDRSSGKIQKIYLCKTRSPVATGIHTHYLSRFSGKMITTTPAEGKICQLQVINCQAYGNEFLVKIILLTGRTHQIRCQMAALEAPLIGDPLYGSANDVNLHTGLQLHASEVIWGSMRICSQLMLH